MSSDKYPGQLFEFSRQKSSRKDHFACVITIFECFHSLIFFGRDFRKLLLSYTYQSFDRSLTLQKRRRTREQSDRSQSRGDLARQNDAAVIAILRKSTRTLCWRGRFAHKKESKLSKAMHGILLFRAKKMEHFGTLTHNLLSYQELMKKPSPENQCNFLENPK